MKMKLRQMLLGLVWFGEAGARNPAGSALRKAQRKRVQPIPPSEKRPAAGVEQQPTRREPDQPHQQQQSKPAAVEGQASLERKVKQPDRTPKRPRSASVR